MSAATTRVRSSQRASRPILTHKLTLSRNAVATLVDIADVCNKRADERQGAFAADVLYTVWRPVGRDILLSFFGLFHWLVGSYCSYCAAQLVTLGLIQ